MQEPRRTKSRKPSIRVTVIDNKLVIKARLTVKGHDVKVDVNLPLSN